MHITSELNDHSIPAKCPIRVHDHPLGRTMIELEVKGERYVLDGVELKKAVDNALNK